MSLDIWVKVAVTALASFGIWTQGLAVDDSAYPIRPVRLIVPVPSGGLPDLVARMVAPRLSESLGKPFVVENRAGAGGAIAVDYVVKSDADGYTLLLSMDAPLTINPSLYKVSYDPEKDLAPILLISSIPMYLLATPSFPPNSLKELITLAKTNPGKFNFASSGNGTNQHLAGELLNTLAGIKLFHVPYKGFGPASIDAMSGKVELIFGTPAATVPLVRSGKLKVLALADSKRSEILPQVPTFIESGFPGFEIIVWVGLLAPARTPRLILDKLHLELAKVLQSKEVSGRLASLGVDINGGGPQEFSARLRSDIQTYARIIKDSGVKAAD